MSGPWEALKPQLPKTLGEQPSPTQHLIVIRGVASHSKTPILCAPFSRCSPVKPLSLSWQWNWLVSFQGGSKELWYHRPLCLSVEKNSARDRVIDKKWHIRMGHLWGLQARGWEMWHPKNLAYSLIIKGKVGRRKRTCLSFFLSSFFLKILGQCPISSDTLSWFLILYGPLPSVRFLFI